MLSFLKKTTQYFFTITTFLFLLSGISNAQSSDIYITISPNNPRVGESVTLSINSNIIDLKKNVNASPPMRDGSVLTACSPNGSCNQRGEWA